MLRFDWSVFWFSVFHVFLASWFFDSLPKSPHLKFSSSELSIDFVGVDDSSKVLGILQKIPKNANMEPREMPRKTKGMYCMHLFKKNRIKNTTFSAFSFLGRQKSSSATRVQKIAVESDMVSIRGFKRFKIHLDFYRGNRGNIFFGKPPWWKVLALEEELRQEEDRNMQSLGPSWWWILGISQVD